MQVKIFNFFFLFLVIFGLSGCALFHREDQTQKTIEAINISEKAITNTLNELKLHLDNQTDSIAQLESKVINLNSEIDSLKQNQRYIIAVQKRSNKTSGFNSIPGPSSSVVTSNVNAQSTQNIASQGIVTLGSLETIYIDTINSAFTARVDTGATTSSINAIDMQEFERNGKKWIKFHVSGDETLDDEQKWVEAPIIRHVKIRQASSNELERRPVVELWIKMGRIHEKAQFTLADRTLMDYPILLGREFMQDVAVVDVGRDFIESSPISKKTNK